MIVYFSLKAFMVDILCKYDLHLRYNYLSMTMLKPIQLKNGLSVLKIPKSGAKTFIVGFVAQTGSSIENKFHPGVTHMVERMLRYGTDKHPSPRHLNTVLEGMGAKFYTETTHELTHFYLSVPSVHQFKAISVLSEIIQHSYVDQQDVQKEKRNQMDAVNYLGQETRYNNGISQIALDNLYYNTPLSFPLKGSIDSLVSIDREDLVDYINHQFRPEHSFLVVSGDFETKNVIDLITQEWGFWNPRSKPYQTNEEDTFRIHGPLPRIMYKQRGQSHTDISFAFLLDQGYKPKNSLSAEEQENEVDLTALKDIQLNKTALLMVLNAVLGNGLTSRLWTKTVEDEMFFNQISSDVVYFKHTGYLQITGSTSNAQFTFALESVLSVLDALKKTTVSINELAKAKELLKGSLINDHEDLFYATYWQICNYMGSEFSYDLEELIEKINRVDAAAIRSLALDLFIPQRLAITTIGTAKETRIVDKLIEKYLA
jgi:predicted Zn-dependent peptidase